VHTFANKFCVSCVIRSSVHGSLQTALASDKPLLEQQLRQIDHDIETTDKDVTKMSFLVPQARNKLILSGVFGL